MVKIKSSDILNAAPINDYFTKNRFDKADDKIMKDFTDLKIVVFCKQNKPDKADKADKEDLKIEV